MNVLLWNWHSPYTRLLALSQPEITFFVLPTTHAPQGWRYDQRPKPENVLTLGAHMVSDHRPSVILLQNERDVLQTQRWLEGVPALYLAHNRAEFDGDGLPYELERAGLPLVAISKMKAESWSYYGYRRPITVIPPGLPDEDYGFGEWEWTGEEACVLTVANNLRRELFDYDAWAAAVQGQRAVLVGEGNQGLRGAIGPAPDWSSLRAQYRRARLYLNVTWWPHEDGYNLALLEAMAAGMPCRALYLYQPNVFVDCATPGRLRAAVELDLSIGDREQLRAAGRTNQATVRRLFGWEAFCRRWRDVLEGVSQ